MIDKIKNAYRKLLKNDIYLLEVNANERSITHKFAIYLQEEFPEWDVDCEYNRNEDVPKRILLEIREYNEKIETTDEDGTTVYPDIIVHHRGTKINLLVIEVKKTSNPSDKDEKKLKAYKVDSRLKYKEAYFIRFPIKDKDKDIDHLSDFTEEKMEGYIKKI